MNSRAETYSTIYERLVTKFPGKPWIAAILRLGSNPPIHKLGEYIISYGLYLYASKKLDELDEYERLAVTEAIFYGQKLVELQEVLPVDKIYAFNARWEAAFGMPADMRALVFENFVYHSLRHFGWSVECKDDQFSGQTFDYLASREENQIQIECKSFSYDKGLAITSAEANNLATKILKYSKVKNQELNNELLVVTVKIQEKLPENRGETDEIVEEICRAINGGISEAANNFSVDIQKFSDLLDIEGDIKSTLPIKCNDSELLCIVSEANGKKKPNLLAHYDDNK